MSFVISESTISLSKIRNSSSTTTVFHSNAAQVSLGYVFSSNGLFFCRSACLLTTLLKRFEWTAIKFYGGVWGGKRNVIKFWCSDGMDHHADYLIRNLAITQY